MFSVQNLTSDVARKMLNGEITQMKSKGMDVAGMYVLTVNCGVVIILHIS